MLLFVCFTAVILLCSNVLPISMYVTVEICNMFQAHFIDSDTELYDVRTNTPAVARTSTMNAGSAVFLRAAPNFLLFCCFRFGYGGVCIF